MSSLSLVHEDGSEISVVKVIDMDGDIKGEHGATNEQLAEIANRIGMDRLRERHYKIIDSFPIEALDREDDEARTTFSQRT
jgi:hypothetical protein